MTTDFSSNPNPNRYPEFVRYIHSELNLSPGELVYGLGEQFGAFVKNGEGICVLACGGLITQVPRTIREHLESRRRDIERASL